MRIDGIEDYPRILPKTPLFQERTPFIPTYYRSLPPFALNTFGLKQQGIIVTGRCGLLLQESLLSAHLFHPRLCVGVALFRGFAIPGNRFTVILRHATALFIHGPTLALRPSVALLGGIAIPGNGFGIILWDITADFVHRAEDSRRLGVTLLRSFAEPGDRFGAILRHAFTCGVPQPEGDLRVGLAGLGADAQVGEFLC